MNNETIDGVPLILLKNIEMTWRQASGLSKKANDIIAEGLGPLRALLAKQPPCAKSQVESVVERQREPVVPTGWKLVPIQPTPEMLKAVDNEADDKHLARGRAVSAWSLMLDAVPEPSVADIEPFALIGDYAACGGGRTVFTPEYAALITDRMCSKTAVYTLGAAGAAVAAIETLNAKGYTYHGAAQWKPPLGNKPDFDLIDSLRADRDRLREGLTDARGMLSTVAGCSTSECEDCKEHAQLHCDAISGLLALDATQ